MRQQKTEVEEAKILTSINSVKVEQNEIKKRLQTLQ